MDFIFIVISIPGKNKDHAITNGMGCLHVFGSEPALTCFKIF